MAMRVTKEQIIEAANTVSGYDGKCHGGFVNVDSDWVMADSPKALADIARRIGFEVTKSYSTATCCAFVETAEGYGIAWNGACMRLVKNEK